MAPRTRPPASKAKSMSRNRGSLATPGADQVHVLLRRLGPVLRELDLDDGVHRAGVGGVGGRPVGVDADLGDDQLQVVLGDRLLDELLDLGDLLLGLLDPGAARGADVHLEGAGVDLGEELAAQDRPEHDERRRQEPEGDARSSAAGAGGRRRAPARRPRTSRRSSPPSGRRPAPARPAPFRCQPFRFRDRSPCPWAWACGLSQAALQAGTSVRDRM